jgi:hypothetical protein
VEAAPFGRGTRLCCMVLGTVRPPELAMLELGDVRTIHSKVGLVRPALPKPFIDGGDGHDVLISPLPEDELRALTTAPNMM